MKACEGLANPVSDVALLKCFRERYHAIIHARAAPTDGGLKALDICVRKTLIYWYGCGGGHRLAQLLGSLYNGGRKSEEHTSELQSLMRISYAVFCLKKKKRPVNYKQHTSSTQEYPYKIDRNT